MSHFISGLTWVIFGLIILSTGEVVPYWNYTVELGVLTYPIGFIFIFIGVYLFINKSENNIATKCPKCKECFNSKDLKNYMCPTCNIKTIEMKEYFKTYPEELMDKEAPFKSQSSEKSKMSTFEHPRTKDLFE